MKKKAMLLLAGVIACIAVYAQTDTTAKPDTYPSFKGGMNGWLNFLQSNLNRDLMGKNNAPEGRYTTVASFVVDSVGGVRDILIEINPGYGAAEETTRILKLSSKKWMPAMKNGVAVSYRHKQSLTLLSSGF